MKKAKSHYLVLSLATLRKENDSLFGSRLLIITLWRSAAMSRERRLNDVHVYVDRRIYLQDKPAFALKKKKN